MKLRHLLTVLCGWTLISCAPVARDDDRGPTPGEWETLTPGDQVRARVEFFRYEGASSAARP